MQTTSKDQIGRLSKIDLIDSITGEKTSLNYKKTQMTVEILGKKHLIKYEGKRTRGERKIYWYRGPHFLRDVTQVNRYGIDYDLHFTSLFLVSSI
ncbi:unnamed protein product [marine sediment metagenome]|uniref:Uncharacterized protein n=1 Tax=marine sediment metagenome TaxID=412755 RepID=X1BG48_9ZZZZ